MYVGIFRLFTEILTEAPQATEIKFLEDGSWHPMTQKDKNEEAGHKIHTIGSK